MRRQTPEADQGRREQSPRSRRWRIASVLTGALLLSYLLLLCFPQIVFAHSLSYRHFRVYSVAPLGQDIRPVLDRADRRLAACEIDEPHTVHRLFLCPSHAVFAVFAPNARLAFADNQPFRHNIFISTADIAQDTVTSGATQHNRRTLSGVIAHECTHTLLAHRFGQVAMLRQPSWKQEGFCDWVAGSTSFDPAQGTRLRALGRSDPSPSFFYFQAYTAVSYLLDDRHWSVSRLMDTPLSLPNVLRAAATPAHPPKQP